jgi:hypothetical protein
LYLWHWPLLSFARIINSETPAVEVRFALVILSFILAWATFQWVEKPIRHSKPSKKIILGLIIGLLVVGIAGHLINKSKGEVARLYLSSNVGHDNYSYKISRQSDNSCELNNKITKEIDEVCLSNSANPEYLFIGDSHAMSLYSSIHAGQVHLRAILFAGHGCSPYLGLNNSVPDKWSKDCNLIIKRGISLIEKLPSLKYVIITSKIFSKKEADNFSGYTFQAQRLTNKQAFKLGTDKLIADIQKSKKKIIYLVDVPHLQFHPDDCIQRISFVTAKNCDLSLSKHNETAFNVDEIYTFREFKGVSFFRLDSILCDSLICIAKKDGNFLYKDRHHLNINGSFLVLTELLKRKISDY